MSSQVRGRPAARLLLGALILAVALSPRIRVPGLLDRAVDLRLQDLLLLPALAYVVARLTSLRVAWGPWALIFASAATVLTVGRLLLDPGLPLLRTIAYFGRALEPLLLAVVVAALYRQSGDGATRAALRAFHAAVAANALWVAYQTVTGTSRTLLGSGVGEMIASYGPKLVGEPSPFGTGFFFAATAALGAAEYRSRISSRRFATALLLVGVGGAYLSGSRIALGAAALCVVALVYLPRAGGKRNLYGSLCLAAISYFTIARLPEATGRLSASGIDSGLDKRIGTIWGPLVRIAWDNALIGIGPGQLGTARYPWTEAHNVILRAVLDYGLVIGALSLAVYATVWWRARRDVVGADATATVQLWGSLASLTIAGAVLGGMVQETLIAVTSTHLIMLAVGLYAGAKLGSLPDPPKPLTPAERRAQQALQHISEPAAADR